MRRSSDFVLARRGFRGRSKRVVISIGSCDVEHKADLPPVKVGFVVPKTVGNSVVRHRLYRQFRHILRDRLEAFSPGELVVVRALPGAATLNFHILEQAIDIALQKARQKQTAVGSEATDGHHVE